MIIECNKEPMLELVLALEGKEFEQGDSVLMAVLDAGTRYCCAGVACELSARAGIGQWMDNYDSFTDPHFARRFAAEDDDGTDSSPYYLPLPVQRRLGIANFVPPEEWQSLETWHGFTVAGIPLTPESNPMGRLAATHMNDTHSTFSEIAAAIRISYGLGGK
jgi:hypothetical protein